MRSRVFHTFATSIREIQSIPVATLVFLRFFFFSSPEAALEALAESWIHYAMIYGRDYEGPGNVAEEFACIGRSHRAVSSRALAVVGRSPEAESP